MAELKSTGALCIVGIKDNYKTYKIEYTTICQSQIIKLHNAQNQDIVIHLYKYCSKSDANKMKDILKDHISILNLNAHWYDIELNHLFDIFIEYFEPSMCDK